jgi:FlaA1/EpsC-like NDP-sugar epimerase
MQKLLTSFNSVRTLLLLALYALVLSTSFYLAYDLRFDFAVPVEFQSNRLVFLVLTLLVKIGLLVLLRQFGSLLSYFSIPDLLRITLAMAVNSLMLNIIWLATAGAQAPPRGVILADFVISVAGLCSLRLGMRLYRERMGGGLKGSSIPQQRIAIVGAGDAGASLAREFINAPSRGFKPVVFFDDDTSKHGKLIHGVPVMGRAESIKGSKDSLDLAKVVIAMPSASAKRIREIVLAMNGEGLKVETLPSMEELTSGRVRASRIRPVEVQDLLGRETVDLDSVGIRKLIEGKVVMVTGAGGSIGSELCRQIASLNPSRLLLVEQAEGSLFNIEQELNELGLGGIALPLVADILDQDRMKFIFRRYQPQVVFHAAAHKHVYLMERQPAEAIHNNVAGTRQLAELAALHSVHAFVFISTDKAINPTSVMGATKRLAELQMMAVAARAGRSDGRMIGGLTTEDGRRGTDAGVGIGRLASGNSAERRTKFIAVRFGNVLGSSGSVIPIFKRQIANGGPVTVTHPDVTRYFMTIPEAVGLVLQSSVLGQGGEIFVLDMGQPVKIVDLARQMIQLSGFKVGEDIEISFTGLKPGEKLYEELRHSTETHQSTEHPRIMRFTTEAMFSESGVEQLEHQLHELEPNELKKRLQRLVPEYTPFLD